MDPALILDAWPLSGPWTSRVVSAGANNRTWFVTGPAGDFVLRVSIDAVDPGGVAAEHRLLRHLARADLPFAIPAPVLSRDGATAVAISPAGGGSAQLASLFPVIAGEEPDPTDHGHITACGVSLRQLHDALRLTETSIIRAGEEADGPRGVGESVATGHGAWVSTIGLSSDEEAQIATLVETTDYTDGVLSTTLPLQIIHGDFDASNVLIDGDCISGILDFEFATIGVRAFDVANGLWSFAVAGREQRDPWPATAAFLRGYQRAGGMDMVEVAALPDLVLIREVNSLRRWAERLRPGSATERGLGQRARTLLALADWVGANRDRLIVTGVKSAPLQIG